MEQVLANLDKIKSATYFFTMSASAPGDTLSFSEPRTIFVREFVNPADPFVGESNAVYNPEDTTRMTEFYDGSVQGRINWDKKIITVDDFHDNPYPIRLVNLTFHTRTGHIIRYALETKDSITTHWQDFGDSSLFTLRVYDQVMEFFTRPFVDPNPFEPSKGKISQYDMWIRKSDGLPFRMRRKMNHNTSFEECRDVKLNTSEEVTFIASDHYPEGFAVKPLVRTNARSVSPLEGKIAPDWILTDLNNQSIGLSDLKGKVILIQFTGVGCGPCHKSLPFLKQLVNDYKKKDFDFVAIETWSKNIEGLKRYQEMNQLNFRFIRSSPEVAKSYDIQAVPAFLILDEHRMIRKVILGYEQGETDKEICDLINGLL